ncbi:MAG TPA: tyrosine-type recombinase/integrase, partial [Bryobacteraceae bacterium]|nr:tyrosine-type recombinase/integrase [Bryobacteraceae bacterium]
YLIQDQGQRVQSFYKAWKRACEDAGVPDTLFHDLRRTAATNMIEAGYTEKEVMEIGGWKTAHVFRRYVIVSSRRMQANAEKLASYLAEKAEKEAEEERRITADATADKTGRIQ